MTALFNYFIWKFLEISNSELHELVINYALRSLLREKTIIGALPELYWSHGAVGPDKTLALLFVAMRLPFDIFAFRIFCKQNKRAVFFFFFWSRREWL